MLIMDISGDHLGETLSLFTIASEFCVFVRYIFALSTVFFHDANMISLAFALSNNVFPYEFDHGYYLQKCVDIETWSD